MGRSMWTGVVTFGMVTIPVRLHTATESSSVAFHQLHEKCDTRIKEQRYCPHCERVVEWAEIVKGYEYEKGKYIELTTEDFDKLPLPSKHTIDVSSFVAAEEINPLYFDSMYYVELDEKGGQKPYKLLMDVMQSQKVVGVAQIAFRSKERLCLLRPVDGRLCLQTLLYEDEIKPTESTKPAALTVSAQEKKMAESLVKAMKGKFEPEKYKDQYTVALKKLIQAKLKGVEVKEVPRNEPTEVADLMEALQASLEKAKGGSRTSKGSTRPAAGHISKAKAKDSTQSKKAQPKKRTRGAA